MYRKRLLSVLIIFAVALSVGAASFDSIISSAKENSPSYKNSVLTYQNGLLSLEKLDEEDETLVTVSGSVTPIDRNDSKDMFGFSTSAEVLTPDRKTTISGKLGYSMDYDNTMKTVTPSLSARHTFDFSGFDSDNIEDLQYAVSKLSTELAYTTSELEFEKTVINTISTLKSALKELDKINKTISDLQKNLDNINKLGTISPDSAQYKNQLNSLEMAKNSKVALEKQYENAKANYKVFTGLEGDGVDALPTPELKLNVLQEGNTSVYIKSLQAEIAEEEYNMEYATQNPKALTISGGTSGSYTDSTLKSGNYSLDAGLSFQANNWSIGASHTSSWDFKNDKATYNPSLTITGKWTNGSLGSAGGSVGSTHDSYTLQSLQNSAVMKRNEYISALTNYTQQAQSLSVRIMQWDFSKSQADANISYLEDVLKNKQELFKKGLATADDVEKAEFDLSQAQYDYEIMILEGLSLERDLKIFGL